MPLKRHHKWMIGSFSTILIIFMITISVMTYVIFVRQEVNYHLLDGKITDLKIETQTNINSISSSLIDTRDNVENLGSQFGVITEEFGLLKASAGEDFSGIIEDSVRSVVTIRTDVSRGTGFLIDEEGYIVTNFHVLNGGSIINAITFEQETISASLVGFNTNLDIALLKIPGTHNAFEFGDSDSTQVGEKVIAIGNPLGLQFSVSEGIVSAIHREGPNGLDAYTQTDAALNPGNSGGPLIDKSGEVIGINNFKIGGGENLGFALESNFIKEAVNGIFQETFGQDLI
ncbi:MAG TPA: trypsin-like serine protease [Candidatus Pacearchaeota archaeon]|nr:trypsin-like serine protease [Candidatus Pacearchaeota archaeon]